MLCLYAALYNGLVLVYVTSSGMTVTHLAAKHGARGRGGGGGGQVLHPAACMHALAMTSAAEIVATVITVVATVITVDVTSWYFTWFRLQGEGVQTRSD